MAIAPVVQAAAVSAAGNLLGGALGNSKYVDPTTGASYWYDRQERYDARKEEYERQKEFAQFGVRWRAKDAAAAGMHPLFAFGGNLAGYSPSASVGGGSVSGYSEEDRMGEALSRSGQDISRAVAAQETAEQRDERVARMLALKASSERDFATAAAQNALAAKYMQETGDRPAFPSDVVTQAYSLPGARDVEAHPLYRDALQLKPDEMTSRGFIGTTAGRGHPAMRDFEFPGGYKALLPASSGGGIPDEIDVSMIPLVIGSNLQRYGWRWIVDTINFMTGKSPMQMDQEERDLKAAFRRLFRLRPEFESQLRR